MIVSWLKRVLGNIIQVTKLISFELLKTEHNNTILRFGLSPNAQERCKFETHKKVEDDEFLLALSNVWLKIINFR